jgi:protein subunit release factor A
MLHSSSSIAIPDHEIDIHAIWSQGAGGQNVNKVDRCSDLAERISCGVRVVEPQRSVDPFDPQLVR